MKRPRIKRSSLNKRRDKPAGIVEKVINILKILNLIEQDKAPSVRTLSEVCEVSERSIYRYLNILYSIVPIVYDSKLGGYRFENERALKVIPFEKKEIALLSSLMDLISKSGKDIQKTFKGIIEKIYICQDKEHAYTPREVFHFITSSTGDSRWLDEITRAVIDSKQLRIKYHAINTGEITERLIDPYGLVFYDGLWFIYAYCHLRGDYRLFATDRIKELETLKTGFLKPEGFSLKESLSLCWGLWEGEIKTVTVRFSKEIAPVIMRKEKWHPTEERKIFEDGSIELTFRVSGLEEIKWWIYSWIPHIEVIAPQELREQLNHDLKEALSRNSSLT